MAVGRTKTAKMHLQIFAGTMVYDLRSGYYRSGRCLRVMHVDNQFRNHTAIKE